MKSSANKNVQQQPQAKFLKWIVLLSFTQSNFVNNIFGEMLIPLWGVLPIYYNVNQSQLNWITNWLYVCPVLFSRFWNILILKNLGISIILSSIITATGIWIAWFAKTDIFMTACGYFLIGVGNSLKCQIPLRTQKYMIDISKMWFEPHERIITTFIGQYACHIGYLFGYGFTSSFFYGLEDWALITERINQLYYIMSILATISVPISFITLIKPQKQDQEGLTRDKLWSSYKKVYFSLESVLDLASAGSIIAFCCIYPALLGIQQVRLKQRQIDIFINGVIFQGFAIIMALICALRLDKQSKKGLQQNYDYYIKLLIIVGFSTLVFELLFLEMMHPQFLNFQSIVQLFDRWWIQQYLLIAS